MKRPGVRDFAGSGLFCFILLLIAVSIGVAQSERAGGERPSRFMNRIDQEEGAKRLELFRSLRLEGDFCFRFELTHKPRRGKNIRYYGTMWGTWNAIGPVSRIRISSKRGPDQGAGEVLEFIVQNGVNPQIWKRTGTDGAFKELTGSEIFEPVLPGLVYTPFDLQMPFVYWEDFEYEGPTRVGMSRVAQQFLMLPPEDAPATAQGVSAVRIGIDDTYNALWRVEVLGADQAVRTKFSVESVKKVQDQYIVRRISILDTATHDKTTFDVVAASVGLILDPAVFDPWQDRSLPEIPESMFEKLD